MEFAQTLCCCIKLSFLITVETTLLTAKPEKVSDPFLYLFVHYFAFFFHYLTILEKEINQMKEYEKQQGEIAHLRAFISSCGTYSNLVKQAKRYIH